MTVKRRVECIQCSRVQEGRANLRAREGREGGRGRGMSEESWRWEEGMRGGGI